MHMRWIAPGKQAWNQSIFRVKIEEELDLPCNWRFSLDCLLFQRAERQVKSSQQHQKGGRKRKRKGKTKSCKQLLCALPKETLKKWMCRSGGSVSCHVEIRYLKVRQYNLSRQRPEIGICHEVFKCHVWAKSRRSKD